MTLYYAGDGVTVWCGDALAVLPMLEAQSVNAVITDPPYGINYDRATWSDSPVDYPDLMHAIIRESNRLTDGPKAFWQALSNIRTWNEWFDFDYRMIAICKGFVQYRPTPIQWSFDPVIVWGTIDKDPSVYSKDWFVQNIAPFGAGRESIAHPSPRPLEAMIYIVDLLTKPDDIVLDPFLGSGTTAVACIRTGRRFVGVEISEEYCAISVKRIERELAQPRLFMQAAAAASPPTQGELF